jgi:hypothetical protein
MAALKKPEKCECGSTKLSHEFKPERWVCDECHKVVAERPQRITGICVVCGKAEGPENQFAGKKNICKVPCYQQEQKEYREENKDALKEYRDEYFKNLGPDVRWQRVRATIERGPRSFLADQMYHIKARSTNPSPRDVKDLERRAFDLDVDYLENLWNQQGGKCALTGLPMAHKFSSLLSASLDRIDSMKGHIKGNIQVVCQWVNSAKNDFTNTEFRAVLDQYFNNRTIAEGYWK